MAKRNHFRSEQQKTYRTQRFKNPYFQVKKMSVKLIILLSSVGFILLIVCLFLLFTNKRFSVSSVEVRGTRYFSEESFKQVVLSYFLNSPLPFVNHRNIFLFRSDDLRAQLEKTFSFESIQINRDGQSVRITIEEKQSQIIWLTQKKRYLADLEGTIIRELSIEEQALIDGPPAIMIDPSIELLRELPIYLNRNNTPVTVGGRVLTKEEIQNISLFTDRLIQMQIGVQRIEIDRLAGKWMGVRTTDEYDILFDATGDIEGQVVRLQTLLKEKITEPAKLEYIDLRFGDHVYFQ